MVLIFNGKFGGGHNCLSPLSMINDGLLDIVLVDRIISTMDIVGVIIDAK
jgi:diacylglycerol kinase family enzyme